MEQIAVCLLQSKDLEGGDCRSLSLSLSLLWAARSELYVFECLLMSVTLSALLAAFVLRICTEDGVGVVLLVMGREVGRWA